MAAALAFVGMWLLSLVTAALAALQLGDFFRAGDELPRVIVAIAAGGTLTLIVLAATYRLAQRASLLDAVAFLLAMLAVALALRPGAIDRLAAAADGPVAAAIVRTFIALEFVIPVLLAILIQWGLARQRWLRVSGELDISRWPWLSTMTACVLALNPFGLALIWSALHASPGDRSNDFAIALLTLAAGALVVMGAIECYIKWRMQRRRLEG